ncbi:tRNA (adenosine(37)-N6)-threonylcarbamoyltransferase complex dimerization subunit type 1 TsaB [Halalkalibacillus halophilus]|uniref:tRNA (adenosine(37)-N6)-threonylcarbamoyltransferase complex dimerization subunit type 1 TsaB n=1 Tax=Halalkalibacillus halophilus TaxID=392827 RepID=UPI0004031A18|nr:tRNA (adenosine(37)-N6)-threonylcarbamoyltransferase complex dimerization subunit type 1 TsaB [Halalkalibacillus halophilus]
MKVLAIDTSNQPMSVAVTENMILESELTVNVKRNHSLQLMPAIEQVLEHASTSIKDIDKIVVAGGPGSYTGLRIGVTTAKSLAWSLDLPIVQVSSLKLTAASLLYMDGYVSPFFDARRGNVFTGLYKVSKGSVEQIIPDQNLSMQDWISKLNEREHPITFISPNADAFKEEIAAQFQLDYQYIEHTLNIPRAGMLASIGVNQDADSVHLIAPNYHRLVEAEAKWLEQQKEE